METGLIVLVELHSVDKPVYDKLSDIMSEGAHFIQGCTMAKVKEILLLDCRKEENLEELKEMLQKLPFLAGKSPTTDMLESIMHKYDAKYGISCDMILRLGSGAGGKKYYSFHIKKGEHHLRMVYGLTLFECLAKSVIYSYFMTKGKQDG
jgi:hypothetical protein